MELVLRADRVLIDGELRPAAVGGRRRRASRPSARSTPTIGGRERRRAAVGRGAAARLRRHPRPRQRTGHRLGGLRHRDRGRGGGRHHHAGGHAAGLRSGDHHGRGAAHQTGSGRGQLPRRRRVLGRRGARTTSTTSRRSPQAGVAGFKCFLADSGNPNFAHLDAGAVPRARWRGSPNSDSVLLVHAESARRHRRQPAAGGRGYASFLDSRPDAAEEDAVALVVDTAAETGARAHVVHVSSARVLPLLADGQARRGPRHRRDLSALSDVRRRDDSRRRHRVRGRARRSATAANRELLWAALRDGTLDMIVSDHSPCAPELKGDGDFGRAFGGISSLQLGPRAVWTQAVAAGLRAGRR